MNITLLTSLETVVTKKNQYLDSDFPGEVFTSTINAATFPFFGLNYGEKRKKEQTI